MCVHCRCMGVPRKTHCASLKAQRLRSRLADQVLSVPSSVSARTLAASSAWPSRSMHNRLVDTLRPSRALTRPAVLPDRRLSRPPSISATPYQWRRRAAFADIGEDTRVDSRANSFLLSRRFESYMPRVAVSLKKRRSASWTLRIGTSQQECRRHTMNGLEPAVMAVGRNVATYHLADRLGFLN
jgi:hypothetical protein